MKKNPPNHPSLPTCVIEYLDLIIKKMGYRRRIRQEVRQELTDHFVDALAEVPLEKQEEAARELIAAFGEAKLLATLIRRGKKRCRPWWKKAMIRSIQTAGLSVVLLILYAFWFAHGQPTISTDYVSQLNQLAQPQITDEQNAWPYYERAIQSFVPPEENLLDLLLKDFCFPDSDTFSPEERHMLSQWIQRNQPTWQQLQLGSTKPYCYKKYDETFFGLSNNLDYLGTLSSICSHTILQARLAIIDQKPQDAIDLFLTVARVGKHWQHQGLTLIQQLVGIGINHRVFTTLTHLLECQTITPRQWQQLQTELEQLYPQGYPMVDFQPQCLILEDTIQRCFTYGGPGGGHIIPEKFFNLIEWEYNHNPIPLLHRFGLTGAMLFHAGRDQTTTQLRNFFKRYTQNTHLTPYKKQKTNVNFDQELDTIPFRIRYLFIRNQWPGFDHAAEYSYRNKISYEATITLVALRRWQLDKGQYPEHLENLVAGGYLRHVPMDPYSDRPLRYQRRGDDFTLYSVGIDFTDNGGTRNEKAEWGDSPENGGGDKIFWPPVM